MIVCAWIDNERSNGKIIDLDLLYFFSCQQNPTAYLCYGGLHSRYKISVFVSRLTLMLVSLRVVQTIEAT